MRTVLRCSCSVLALTFGLLAATGCASGRRPGSYLPVGARAPYGADTDDGVVVTVALLPAAAVDTARAALRANGYTVLAAGDRGMVVRTAALALGSDTSLTVRAEVLATSPAEPLSSIVLTGTYSVPLRGVRGAPVIQRRGEVSPLYRRLRVVADSIRRRVRPAP